MASFFYTTESTESINPNIRCCPLLLELLLAIRTEIMEEIHNMEQSFIKLQTIYGFASQLSFFMLCEQLLNKPSNSNQKVEKNIVVALSTTLFYSVFGYFVTRVCEICQGSRTRTRPRSPSYLNYLKWICRIAVEWAKAIIIVLCLRDQGIHYEPQLPYTIVTFTYYLMTEKVFIEMFPLFIENFNINKLENLEHLYIPFFMNVTVIVAGVFVALCSLYSNYSNFIFVNVYFMVYLRVKDAYHNYWEVLMAEREAYSSFQVASPKEIQEWNDICAVCLNSMSNARITPCNHLFHPYCLKQCLKQSFLCPLCKQHFLDVVTHEK
ncbi:uncharacterized protein LOC143201289 isoform X1 [Rhynchophorus ferrugineus]|uniref:uncharacterized protein LOC143201289 isoform X1 n=2 Tax=Rhynchophorus ferrugineus TaxID=354439 RepID=UPI003FCD6C1A